MKKIVLTLLGLCMLFLAACGNQAAVSEPIVLKNQDGTEITFPGSKPVLFFFMTTYT
ncbi:hypothetical protein ACOI1C_19935 [Bacillus sp. DJP31]|uniref:hypothetical protein n=1 Tax=Bacillus sp. DJP31 TaxID=3409789 RepID=UPI003BB52D6C